MVCSFCRHLYHLWVLIKLYCQNCRELIMGACTINIKDTNFMQSTSDNFDKSFASSEVAEAYHLWSSVIQLLLRDRATTTLLSSAM